MHILGITLTPAAQAIAGWLIVGILALVCIALIGLIVALIKEIEAFYF